MTPAQPRSARGTRAGTASRRSPERSLASAPDQTETRTVTVAASSAPAPTARPSTARTEPDVPAYGLAPPTVKDAHTALQRIYRDTADALWTRLLEQTGLTGTESDRASLDTLLAAMTATGNPVIALSARALAVRVASYDHLSAAQATVRRSHE
jgi:hypothetical protein